MKCEYHCKLHTINDNAQPFYSRLCGLGRVMIIFNFIIKWLFRNELEVDDFIAE